MYLKDKGHSLVVLLIYTISIITSPPVGFCEPTAPPSEPHSRLAVHNVRGRVLTRSSGRLSKREDGHEQHLHLSQADDEWRKAPVSVGRTKSEGGRSSQRPSDEDCGKGNILHVIYGRFYIPGQLDVNLHSVGYQSDSAGSDQSASVRVQRIRGSEENWQRLQPVVECGDDAMTLTVRRRRAAQIQLDRVNESPIPLSQLPPHCGYSVQTTWRDLSLTVGYNACHVSQEDDRYVLPLLWRGIPVRISCPVSQIQPQATGSSSLCCSPFSMTVRVRGPSSPGELRVNVRGEWTPLLVLAEQCGYTLDKRGAEMVITAPFMTCGITVKDGKYTLSLQIGDKVFTHSCPVSPHEELSQTQEPLVDISHYKIREPEPESLKLPLWAPPFYLAPLYYPHPTYHHKYPTTYAHNGYSPPPPLITPDPAFGPQPLPETHHISVRESSEDFHAHGSLSPTDELEESNKVFADLHQKQSIPFLNLFHKSGDEGMPHLQPPGHAFNPYYHYYHHPKIPLHAPPRPPHTPHPGPELPEELSSPKSDNHEFPGLPRSVPEIPQSVSEGPYVFPTSATSAQATPEPYVPSPPYHFSHHYFSYFPYEVMDEANGAMPLHPDMAAKTNHSNAVDHKHIEHPEIIKEEKCRSKQISVKPELEDKNRHQPIYPPGPSSHYPFFYPYYNPYYHYYNGPETLHSAEKHPTSKEALETHQTTTAPTTRSTATVQNPPLNPYYYYFYGKASSESQFPPDLDHSRMDLLAPKEAEYLNILQPLYLLFSSSYYPFVTEQRLHDAFGRLSGKEDGLRAATPLASPCGLASDNECSKTLGCCSYPVKDCTVGQHFVFVVPDSVLEPTVPHPAYLLKDGNVSCTLEKLASDPDVYMVPLEGCVMMQVCGQTVVHLLEVHGIFSHGQDHTRKENSAVRLMVICTFSPGSPSEMSLHVIDQPPPPPVQSAPTTVQLRIAKDQTFTSFHPEAHLPLSLLRGRLIYLEVSLLDPPDPELVLLVHSCLAYIAAPYNSWMLVYDSCLGWADQQLLPAPHSNSHHIRRILVSTFLPLPSETPPATTKGGSSHEEDPEVFFLCWTDVCSTADADCTVGCVDRLDSDVGAMK